MNRKVIYLWLLACCLTVCGAYGQTGDFAVSGTVTDQATNETLPGVSIKVKGTSVGAVTDLNGKYSLMVSSKNAVLEFSFLGYDKKEVPVDNRAVINLKLAQQSTALSEVVVVGYSSQSREKTIAAVSKVDPKQLQNRTDAGPLSALQGKVAGLSVPVTQGQPGAAPTNIIIRGSSKLNAYGQGTGNSGGDPVLNNDAASPLVIIDGVFRGMRDINPDDIESIQVAKDAASTAIYGARGANGVIVVKTKSGKFNSGKANITFNYRNSFETPARDYKYLDATEYLRLARLTAKNTTDPVDRNLLLNNGGFSAGTRVYTAKGQYGSNINLTGLYDNVVAIEGQAYVNNLLANGYMTMDDPANPGTKLIYADNNYQDLLWNTGHSNNYNFSIDGGGEAANYNVSMNYVNQQGTFVGTNYKRYNAIGNFGIKASKNLQINTNFTYQNVLPNYVEGYTNDLVRATRITPLIRIFGDDGLPLAGENLTTRNRFHTLEYDNTRISTERVIARTDADWTIVKNLHFKPSISYLIDDRKDLFNRKAFPGTIQFAQQRLKSEQVADNRQLMIDQVLQYNFNLSDDHSFMILGGFNYTRNNRNTINIGSQRATNDYITTIEEPSTTVINSVITTNVVNFTTGLSENKSASMFGQANYDYQGKYLVGGTVRYDGFSNFAPNFRYAFFPSVSAGWNIHKEKFWKSKLVNALKLRGSWGGAGSNDLLVTDTYGNYNANAYAQSPGIFRANLANPNLKWETTETADLAVDVSFLNSRFNLTVDVYNKLTKDRIEAKPLPLESPFATILYNNGTIRNRGIEFEFGGTLLRIKDFSWNANMSFSYNSQKVVSLPFNGRDRNRQNGGTVYDPAQGRDIEVGGYAEGERPFAYYAWQVEKIFATEAEAKAWGKVDRMASAVGITNGKHAGDYKFSDLNNDNIIDEKDLVKVGYKTPNKFAGMQNTFTYKSLSMRVNLDYVGGHVIGDGALARALGTGRAYNEGAPSQALGTDIWQKEGDEGKKYARFSLGDADVGQKNYIRQASSTVGTGSAYGADVSTMIEKGDFLAFREVYLSYALPKNLTNRIKANQLTVFGSVTNIGYLTKYKGLNPESYVGFDPGGYPRARQFTIGASLKF